MKKLQTIEYQFAWISWLNGFVGGGRLQTQGVSYAPSWARIATSSIAAEDIENGSGSLTLSAEFQAASRFDGVAVSGSSAPW